MVSPFQNAIGAFLGAVDAIAGVTVTYRRGVEEVALTATVGESLFETAEQDNLLTTYRSRDYLLDAADLVLSGVQVLPQKGDQIEETIDGEVHTFQVLPIAADGKPFTWSDRGRTRLRIHTKQIETE